MLLQPGGDGAAGARPGGVDTIHWPGGGAAAPVGNDKSMVPNKDPYSGKFTELFQKGKKTPISSSV